MTSSLERLSCQYPKAARKAAIMLFGPAYPVKIEINPQLGTGEYKTKPYYIESSTQMIPEKVLMDLYTHVSSSLHEEFKRIKEDRFLNDNAPHLLEEIASIGSGFRMLVDAGLNDTYVQPDAMRILREREIAISQIANDELGLLQSRPGFKQSVQLTPDKLEHILEKARDVANTMLIEQSRGRS